MPALSIGRLDDVRPGTLLVAMPSLTDPTFAGTVVYVLDHSDTGTLGRRPGPAQPGARSATCCPAGATWPSSPGVFHVGGPCEADTALCLAIAPRRGPPTRTAALRRVAGDVYLVDLDGDPAELPEQLTGLRVFAGYAGLVAGPAGRRDRRGRLGVRAGPARTTC